MNKESSLMNKEEFVNSHEPTSEYELTTTNGPIRTDETCNIQIARDATVPPTARSGYTLQTFRSMGDDVTGLQDQIGQLTDFCAGMDSKKPDFSQE